MNHYPIYQLKTIKKSILKKCNVQFFSKANKPTFK